MQFEDTSLCIYGVSNRSDASLRGSKSFTNFVPPDWKLGQKVSVNSDKDDINDLEAPLHKKKNLTNPYIDNEALRKCFKFKWATSFFVYALQTRLGAAVFLYHRSII